MTTQRKRESLAELRGRAAASETPAELRRLHSEIAGDPRRGARALADGLERRLARITQDRRRVSRLFAHRRSLFQRGLQRIAGVDEVGVGPLAGPVVAAAVILPERVELPRLDDSKKLTPRLREDLDRAIREQACAISIGEADVLEIDRINILQATLQAMRRAVAGLSAVPEHVLVDARTIPGLRAPQTAFVGGDGRDGSIAAASIVAKVHRDALMRRLDERYPGYGLARHMGYGTAEHLQALRRLGPREIHRQSFQPVREAMVHSAARAPTHSPSPAP